MEIVLIYLIFAMFATVWIDVTRYTIPNWLVGSLLLLYPIAVYISPVAVDWRMALAGMAIIFACGLVVFSFKWMGGGDIKLITVLSLWVGWHDLLSFIFLFALIGGLFCLVILILRRTHMYLPWKQRGKTPRLLQQNGPVPYGVAIAPAFLWFIWQGEIDMLVF